MQIICKKITTPAAGRFAAVVRNFAGPVSWADAAGQIRLAGVICRGAAIAGSADLRPFVLWQIKDQRKAIGLCIKLPLAEIADFDAIAGLQAKLRRVLSQALCL